MSSKIEKLEKTISDLIESITDELTNKLFKAERLIISDVTRDKDTIKAHIKNTYEFLLTQLLQSILKSTDEDIIMVNIENIKSVVYSELLKRHTKKELKPKKVFSDEQKKIQKEKRKLKREQQKQDPNKTQQPKMKSIKKNNALSFKLIMENK